MHRKYGEALPILEAADLADARGGCHGAHHGGCEGGSATGGGFVFRYSGQGGFGYRYDCDDFQPEDGYGWESCATVSFCR